VVLDARARERRIVPALVARRNDVDVPVQEQRLCGACAGQVRNQVRSGSLASTRMASPADVSKAAIHSMQPTGAASDAQQKPPHRGPRRVEGATEAIGVQPASVTVSSTRGAVIHQVKGGEADAVLLIVPDDNHTAGLVDAWVRGDANDNEALRVLYVAATRARRLLAIAIPEDQHGRLAQHLTSRGVPLSGFS
jgi:hypothetical protein